MTFVPLKIPSGVIKTRTGEGAMGRWIDGRNVRFIAGKPQKRAGYERINNTLMLGKARGMEAWNTVRGEPLYAVGTNLKLYGSTDGADVIDITPLRFPQRWFEQLSITEDHGTITVEEPDHGLLVGQQFIVYGGSYAGGQYVGGLLIEGIWEIVDVVDADHFVIASTADEGTLGTDPLTTQSGQPTVTVAHTAHGRATGDTVWLDGATLVNGITPQGDYQITLVDANSYTITHGSNATGTGAGGGAAVTYHYNAAATDTVSDGGDIDYLVTLTDPFTTTNGDESVEVSHPGHGARAGDTIHVSGASAVGGVTIDGAYLVDTVIGANAYTIQHTSAATSGATGGGTVLIEYELSTGPADKITAALRGFGTGPLGSGFFGASGPANDATYFDPRTWSIDKNGEDAIACPLGGTLYYWDSSLAGRADRIPFAPDMVRFAFQTEERQPHALGIDGDPLQFGWASQGTLDDWAPTETNTAGLRRVKEGSALIAGAPVGAGMNLLWTDTSVYRHQYTGSKFIYDTELDAKEAGLIAPQAFAVTPIGVLWMSQARFKMWNGSTLDVPNSSDIEDWVFRNLDPKQKSKCFAHYDAVNNTVDFYFVPLNGAEPSLVATVCLDDFSWVNNEETRTTGSAFPAGDQKPLRVNEGKVFQHETGLDAEGAAAPSSITLAPYAIGDDWSEILGFDPDFRRQTGDVEILISTYDRSDRSPVDTETETFSDDDEIVDLRSSGRHISLTLSQQLPGGDWALDTPKIDVQPMGKRR